jgi:hypothetical protein
MLQFLYSWLQRVVRRRKSAQLKKRLLNNPLRACTYEEIVDAAAISDQFARWQHPLPSLKTRTLIMSAENKTLAHELVLSEAELDYIAGLLTAPLSGGDERERLRRITNYCDGLHSIAFHDPEKQEIDRRINTACVLLLAAQMHLIHYHRVTASDGAVWLQLRLGASADKYSAR